MNRENYETYYETLLSPEMIVIGQLTTLLSYPSTDQAVLAAHIDRLPLNAAFVLRALNNNEDVRGMATYYVTDHFADAHAPFIAGWGTGCLTGFVQRLNSYSAKIRAHVTSEFREGSEVE
jgi:hypothetical protein